MSSAITTPPAKLTLPSTSKMSLHDRFTKLAKAKPATSAAAPTVSSAVKGVPAVAGARASAKNRKLALQMASRPSVQAALKIKNKSIKQRLGTLKPATGRPVNKPVNSAATNVKSRLSPQKGNAVGGIDPARLSLPANPGAGRFQNGANRRGGPHGAVQPNQRRSLNLNTSANSAGIRRVGAGGGMGIKGGRRSLKSRLSNTNALNTNVKRFTRPGNPGGRRGGRAVNPNRPQQQQGKKPAPNGGQQAAQPPKSRENLDMDLDQYMAKSKTHLDHDLDAYMAQSGAN